MTKDEALKLALEALEYTTTVANFLLGNEKDIGPMLKAREAITALREALAEQPAQQKPVNLRRGDLLRCIETDELCTVWATSPTGNTLIKWSANNFGNYTAEQIGELFWLEPAQQEPVACQYAKDVAMPEYRCVGRCQYDTFPPAQQQPFGYFKAEPFGWTDCAETDEGAVALYEHPPAQQEPVGMVKDLFTNAAWDKLDVVGSTKVYLAAAPQPAQQEPVAWRWSESNGQRWFDWTTDWSHHDKAKSMGFPIEYAYTSPPAQRTWQGLTDEELDDIYQGAGKNDLQRARAIEAKLKEKNT